MKWVSAITEIRKLAVLNKQKQEQEKSGLLDDLLTGRVRVTPLLAEQTTKGNP